MPPKKKIPKKKSRGKELGPNRKRLIAAALCLLSILVIISLLMGYTSIANDMQVLRENGNIFSWFSTSQQSTDNPIGIFGILVGYVFIYIFGYWLALFGFIIIATIAFQYFVEPERELIRQKAYLLIITLFFVQALVSAALEGYSQSILPY
ncbi:MAG: DNA translocase FtsK 4TM domain-containing protein, partial [Candidatus Cloacimonetes bacterium]|nr:DNA translocase FtsK 4TM domain-containing protein [Candidatus Cloacimonadota bacterium]